MTKNEKLSLIDRFEIAVEPLIDFVKALPVGALDFRPALPEAWTIREHAVHFLDADTFAHGRLRLAVAEPGAQVYVWDEAAWQRRLRYDTGEALAALESARLLRRVSVAMAQALVDNDWEAYYVRHPQRGRLTIADVFTTYIEHADFHLSYLRRNLEAFAATAG